MSSDTSEGPHGRTGHPPSAPDAEPKDANVGTEAWCEQCGSVVTVGSSPSPTAKTTSPPSSSDRDLSVSEGNRMSDQTMWVRDSWEAPYAYHRTGDYFRSATPAEVVAAFRRLATCPRCGGKGEKTCRCRGEFHVCVPPFSGPCPDCGGSGLAGIEAAAKANWETGNSGRFRPWDQLDTELQRLWLSMTAAAVGAWLTEIGGQEQ